MDLPAIELELIEDISPKHADGFLRLVRRRYRACYPDGTKSEPFVYDAVDRSALDAVVMVAHFRDASQARQVYLRSALRPPLTLRTREKSPLPAERLDGGLWELPAGLVEPSEQSQDGLRRAAQRELAEELGFDVELAALRELGPSTFPAPGIIAERHFYFEVEVEPSHRRAPDLDGSALEHFGVVTAVSLQEALNKCRSGQIEDAKTELALRRLVERFA
ncbi:MAG TPA: NUDIX domain-containing protein [Polyangiaceae bacterium]